jgi:lambda family phage minor tail protein L
MALISVLANVQRHAIASGEPWLLLLNLVWPGTPTIGVTQQNVRFVRNVDAYTFDCGDGNGPQVYQPLAFEMGEFNMSSNGSVPTVEVQASNVMRVLQAIIEQYAGVVGANLYLYAVNTANPAGEPDLTLQFTVTQSICDAKLVHLKCGASSPMRRLFPIYTYWPNTCIWQYKGPQCGYSGSISTCSKTLDGPTGCEAHSNSVRFGGFPGIDTNGITAASVV